MSNSTREEVNEQILNTLADIIAGNSGPGSPSSQVAALVQQKLAGVVQAEPSLALGKALEKYQAEKNAGWAPKTRLDARLVHAWIIEHFGAATPIASIKKAQAASFREGLLRLEKHSKASTFVARQTGSASQAITPRTADKYLTFAVAFFNWASAEAGLIEHSPFSKLTIKFSKKNSRAAAAATPEALREIFLTPLFQGHHPLKPWLKGPIVTQGDLYWLFVLQFYFGTRIGEIAQLRGTDVQLDAEIPYVHLRTVDDEGELINGNTLKTVNAHRKMPICDDLVALGFVKFVQRKRRGKAYLLADVAPSRGQSSSSKASKAASRYLVRVEQKNPGKATHWFRHALATALRSSKTPEYTIAQIFGHSQAAMHTQYGTLEDLAAAKDALDNADWKFNPRAVLLKSKQRWRW